MKHNAATWKNKEEFTALERKVMAETIGEMDSTIKMLITAIKSALEDPENWQVHLNSALGAIDNEQS